MNEGVPEVIMENTCKENLKWMKEHDGKMHRIMDVSHIEGCSLEGLVFWLVAGDSWHKGYAFH